MRLRLLCIGLLATGSLAACGQKGPLYLPRPERATAVPQPASSQPTAATGTAQPATLPQPRSSMSPVSPPR